MYPLVDFITQVKKVEYLLALLGIAVFLVYWELLKPTPFRTMMTTGREDLNHVKRAGGFRYIMKNIGRIAAAPFIGFAYIVILVVGFFAVLAAALVNLGIKGAARAAGKSVSFEWRPVEAYLAGRKRRIKKKKNDESQKKARKAQRIAGIRRARLRGSILVAEYGSS